MESDNTYSAFDALIWGGACVSLIGLAGLIWCILLIAKAKRAKLDDAQMRDALKAVMPLNLGALLLSVLGLMMVVVGILVQ